MVFNTHPRRACYSNVFVSLLPFSAPRPPPVVLVLNLFTFELFLTPFFDIVPSWLSNPPPVAIASASIASLHSSSPHQKPPPSSIANGTKTEKKIISHCSPQLLLYDS
ncbi:hypothetical protein PM082_001447 [Marasmius tenuissimus]|nr:hypothetical protein PM082_001447 [Marasmius tenuissimus]